MSELYNVPVTAFAVQVKLEIIHCIFLKLIFIKPMSIKFLAVENTPSSSYKAF